MYDKILLIIPVLAINVCAYSQHLETTIKVVEGKARIAVKATGGDVIGYPSNYVMVVAIPKANADAGVELSMPIKLDASRNSESSLATLPAHSDAAYKYFLLFYTGARSNNTASPTIFKDREEYDILELTWDGPYQSFPVSLMSLPDGNPRSSVAASQWQHYLEIGGAEVSSPHNYFYQSATSNRPINAQDYSNGTAIITTSIAINSKQQVITRDPPISLAIGGLYPNPANAYVNVVIEAAKKDNVTLIVTDLAGRKVKQQLASVEAGSNTIPVQIASLATGSYIIKVLCKSTDCETAVGKFNKQ